MDLDDDWESREAYQNSVKESNKEELSTPLLTEDNLQEVNLRSEEQPVQYYQVLIYQTKS